MKGIGGLGPLLRVGEPPLPRCTHCFVCDTPPKLRRLPRQCVQCIFAICVIAPLSPLSNRKYFYWVWVFGCNFCAMCTTFMALTMCIVHPKVMEVLIALRLLSPGRAIRGNT